MDLTSGAFIWTVRILLVVAVLWALLRWGKAAKPTVLSFLKRIVTLLVVSLLAVVNVAAPINAENGWFVSWKDLGDFIAGGGNAPEVPGTNEHGGDTPQKAMDDAAQKSDADITGDRQRPQMDLNLTSTNVSGWQDFQVKGAKSGYTGTLTVWVPPSYTTAEGANRQYPVIETFHGIRPAPYAVFNAVKLDQLMMDAVDKKQMREALILAPHWAPDGTDNECTDVPGGTKMETWLTQDVPAWVYSHFRVQPGRDSWSAFGMSAGGWCANMASMLHPGTFGSAISLGGYWQPDFDEPYVPFRPGSESWKHYDLLALAKRKPPAVALWTLTSKSDSLSYPTTAKFLKDAKPPTSLTSVVLQQGGHRTDVWVPHIPDALAWLGKSSKAFAAQ